MKKMIVFFSLLALLVIAPGAMAIQASGSTADAVNLADPNLDDSNNLRNLDSAGVQNLSATNQTGERTGACCLGPGMNSPVSLDANTNPGGGGSRPVNGGGLSN